MSGQAIANVCARANWFQQVLGSVHRCRNTRFVRLLWNLPFVSYSRCKPIISIYSAKFCLAWKLFRNLLFAAQYYHKFHHNSQLFTRKVGLQHRTVFIVTIRTHNATICAPISLPPKSSRLLHVPLRCPRSFTARPLIEFPLKVAQSLALPSCWTRPVAMSLSMQKNTNQITWWSNLLNVPSSMVYSALIYRQRSHRKTQTVSVEKVLIRPGERNFNNSWLLRRASEGSWWREAERERKGGKQSILSKEE